mmetsp:Transcript_44513/g.132883  ORF Transcript_44513/g.132883 Transcript_44513/m.132883 type:complete len:370 (+) Transcript_44513:500-1609(+)
MTLCMVMRCMILLLLLRLAQASVLHRVGQEEERNPDQHAASCNVDDAEVPVLGAERGRFPRAVLQAGVSPIHPDTPVVFPGAQQGEEDSSREELSGLECHDELYKLVLIRRARQDGEDEEEEVQEAAQDWHEGDRQEDEVDGVLELPEEGSVVRQPVIQQETTDCERVAAVGRLPPNLGKARDVVHAVACDPDSSRLHHDLHLCRDVAPELVHEVLDPAPQALTHVRVGRQGLLESVPHRRHHELAPRPDHVDQRELRRALLIGHGLRHLARGAPQLPPHVQASDGRGAREVLRHRDVCGLRPSAPEPPADAQARRRGHPQGLLEVRQLDPHAKRGPDARPGVGELEVPLEGNRIEVDGGKLRATEEVV